ncbi:MAG: hypothetical protein F6J93_10445 [Oscillatoria sp. SIO1A7]|nr:hypothetical protein [Oscillatoria sp. SIO1A7]
MRAIALSGIFTHNPYGTRSQCMYAFRVGARNEILIVSDRQSAVSSQQSEEPIAER